MTGPVRGSDGACCGGQQRCPACRMTPCVCDFCAVCNKPDCGQRVVDVGARPLHWPTAADLAEIDACDEED